MKQVRAYVLLIVAVLCVQPVTGWAQADEPMNRQTLAGHSVVAVFVVPVDPAITNLGLSKEALQTDAELRLRASGIRVVSAQEAAQTPTYPVLFIHLDALIPTSPRGVGLEGYLESLFFAKVNVQFFQWVSLASNPSTRVWTATWESSGFLGYGGLSDLRGLRQRVADNVDQFINAFLSVNPRR